MGGTRHPTRWARGLVAVGIFVGALLCLLPAGCSSCHDMLEYHEVDLMRFCVGSGKCQYGGQTVVCHPPSQAQCSASCGDAGQPDCMKSCLDGPSIDCPYLYAWGGDWEFPLDALGSARDGLTVLHVELVHTPAYQGEIKVSADGNVVCRKAGSYAEPEGYLTLDCPLPGQPRWVRVDASDLAYVYLREPTRTKHTQVCGA